MTTKLIRLEDGVLVEVEIPGSQFEPLSGGVADKVSSALEVMKPILHKVCQPMIQFWNEINKDVQIDEIDIELGLGFEGEGNLFITKSSMNANITITIKLKPVKNLDDENHD